MLPLCRGPSHEKNQQKHPRPESRQNKFSISKKMGDKSALTALLHNLASRIRTESSAASVDLSKRARLAQVSAVECVCAQCLKYLTGEVDLLLRAPLTPGEIRDLLDSAEIELRENGVARSEAERELRVREAAAIPDTNRDKLLSALLKSESAACSRLHDAEYRLASASAAAMQTCVREMIDILVSALHDARAPGLLPGSQRRIASEAKDNIAKVASAWTVWFTKSEGTNPSCWRTEAPNTRELAADPEAQDILVALFKTLKLCRHQGRTAAAVLRLKASASACDALSALVASVDDVSSQTVVA